MSRQSSSPDSLTFENIYQLPFFLSATSPFLFSFNSKSGSRAPEAASVQWGTTDGETGCFSEVFYGRPLC